MAGKIDFKISSQFNLSKSLKDRLKNAQEQSGIPMTRIVTDALKKYLPVFEKEHKIQPLLSSNEE